MRSPRARLADHILAMASNNFSVDNLTTSFVADDCRRQTNGSVVCEALPSDYDLEETGNPFVLPLYFRVGYTIAFVSMAAISAGGNMGVVWIVMTQRRMRTVTNYFLVNLAIADALISIFNTVFNFVFMLYSDWPFGEPYCKFTQFIAPCTIAASVFTFIAIAVDR